MLDRQQIEATLLKLLDEMQGDLGDAHEIQIRLRQTLNSMRAQGMPLPDDLVRMDEELSTEFKAEMQPQ